METIYALATTRGRSAVAIIRLSGPKSHEVVLALTQKPLPELRFAALRRFYHKNELLDEGLVLLFDQKSFTGEISAEIQIHGSIAVVRSMLEALADFQGLRLAEAGEFTRRALENGCLDLAQVEGLADLIDAETHLQRRQALQALSGHLGEKVKLWREKLVRSVALLEATIDFVDEDVPVDVFPEVTLLIQDLLDELTKEIEGSFFAERLRDGFEIAIIGSPNAGKSTLLNALAGREAAIISDIAGTTRDIIEVRMDLDGLPVTFLDTAGLRETDDQVESIGISRAINRAENADIRVFLLEYAGQELPLRPYEHDIVLLGKIDLYPDKGSGGISGLTGQGVDQLMLQIKTCLMQKNMQSGMLVRERHRIAVRDAVMLLENALLQLKGNVPQVELIADDVHGAIRSIDLLVGKIGVEDILGEIFSRFCIGK